MTAHINRRWLLAARPSGPITAANFRWVEEIVPTAGPGQCVVRTIMVSVDPAMRGWMTDAPSYVPPVALGEVMRAYGGGRVVASSDPALPEGTLVTGMTGWQDYCLGGAGTSVSLSPVQHGFSLARSLSVFNITGFSAYFGLLDIGQPRSGETVVVTGAAGAVGSIAGQIAKIMGCRVVGIAGSAAKCAWVVNELAFDAALNYREPDLPRRLAEACPNGVDLVFDNTGGEPLDAALALLNLHARVVLCGRIAMSGGAGPVAAGPANYGRLIPTRGTMRGFIVSDYASRFGEAANVMYRWMREGFLLSQEQFVEGLERAPEALQMLFEGKNTGKLLVRVVDSAAGGV